MEDHEYTNRFIEVHRKAKVFRERLSEANKSDAELRKSRTTREIGSIAQGDVLPFRRIDPIG